MDLPAGILCSRLVTLAIHPRSEPGDFVKECAFVAQRRQAERGRHQPARGDLAAGVGKRLRLLQRLQREKSLSYLLITHDVDVIRAMAHAVLVMKDGLIIESGPVAQVLDAPREAYTQRLVAAALA